MPSGCRSGEPAQEDVQASLRIIRGDEPSYGREQLTRVSDEISTLRSEFVQNRTDLNRVLERLNGLTTEMQLMRSRYSTNVATSNPAVSRPSLTITGIYFLYFLLGFLLAAMLGASLAMYLRTRYKVIPQRVGVRHEDKLVVFDLVEEARHYKCPLCDAKDVELKHIERHLGRRHDSSEKLGASNDTIRVTP